MEKFIPEFLKELLAEFLSKLQKKNLNKLSETIVLNLTTEFLNKLAKEIPNELNQIIINKIPENFITWRDSLGNFRSYSLTNFGLISKEILDDFLKNFQINLLRTSSTKCSIKEFASEILK